MDKFTYNLEKVKTAISNATHSITEYEGTFSNKAERARSQNKDYFWTAIHEYECTVKLYRYIQEQLISFFRILIDSIEQQEKDNHSLKEENRFLKEEIQRLRYRDEMKVEDYLDGVRAKFNLRKLDQEGLKSA